MALRKLPVKNAKSIREEKWWKIRIKESELKSQKSELKSQKSEVRSQKYKFEAINERIEYKQ